MGTVTKAFHFSIDAEGWTPTAGDAQISMAHYPWHGKTGRVTDRRNHFIADPMLTMGGCLKTTAKRNAPSTENYWQWSGTWEDLGVTPGATVTAVQADHLWRVHLKGGTPRASSNATWGVNEVGSGPFELRDSGGTLLDTFSARSYAPARSGGDPRNYPVSIDNHVPANFIPSGWQHRVGSNVSVPAPQQPSNSTIKLRLRSLLPLTIDGYDTWVRIKQDYVKLTITTASPSFDGPSNRNFF